MQVRQLQVVVDALQDRLLLRVATDTKEEIRVHLTRRFLRELWPALVGMLFGHLGSKPSPAADKGKPPAGNFEQPYRNEDPSFPLGSTPLLAAEAVVEPAGDGLCRLTLRELKERSFTLPLSADLLQALCSMLRATSQQAGWDLTLDYGHAAPVPRSDSGPKKHLH